MALPNTRRSRRARSLSGARTAIFLHRVYPLAAVPRMPMAMGRVTRRPRPQASQNIFGRRSTTAGSSAPGVILRRLTSPASVRRLTLRFGLYEPMLQPRPRIDTVSAVHTVEHHDEYWLFFHAGLFLVFHAGLFLGFHHRTPFVVVGRHRLRSTRNTASLPGRIVGFAGSVSWKLNVLSNRFFTSNSSRPDRRGSLYPIAPSTTQKSL